MHRPSEVKVLAAAVALAVAGCGSAGTQTAPIATGSTPAADVRGTPVVPGRPARVYILAAYDAACNSLAAPGITVDKPPRQGTVSFQPGQETTVMASEKGTCIGAKVKGTGIYYTAKAEASGGDSFSISVKPASGEASTRTFNVKIAE